jgi:hypothetical protein
MQQKRFPCPANGTLASANATAGVEVAPDVNGCTTDESGGVVPWRTLGLGEADTTDGWDRRLTYRVQKALASTSTTAPPLDMSQCDPAAPVSGVAKANCTAGCTSAGIALCTAPADFLIGKGLEIRNVAGTTIMNPAVSPSTAAAYVVISPGETGGGGYLGSGTLATSTTVDGTQEATNYANLALRAYYVDDSLNGTSGTAHFDDIVSRPSLLTVINKAGLGPRSHL